MTLTRDSYKIYFHCYYGANRTKPKKRGTIFSGTRRPPSCPGAVLSAWVRGHLPRPGTRALSLSVRRLPAGGGRIFSGAWRSGVPAARGLIRLVRSERKVAIALLLRERSGWASNSGLPSLQGSQSRQARAAPGRPAPAARSASWSGPRTAVPLRPAAGPWRAAAVAKTVPHRVQNFESLLIALLPQDGQEGRTGAPHLSQNCARVSETTSPQLSQTGKCVIRHVNDR